jgi:hypothetical protein
MPLVTGTVITASSPVLATNNAVPVLLNAMPLAPNGVSSAKTQSQEFGLSPDTKAMA